MCSQADDALVRAAASGDPRAARQLHDRFAPVVFAVVNRMAPDPGTAEDWAQEAWLRIFRALPGYRGQARFSTWVHRVAVNAALQEIRARRTRWQREAEAGAAEEPSSPPATPALRVALERALAELPEGMRRILLLHDVEGYTHADIAAELGIAEGTSKSRVARARRRLRAALEGGSGATEGAGKASHGRSPRRPGRRGSPSRDRSLVCDAA
jgi:RNA polymerase sigma-70 factor (ECF subfamily)